MDILTYKEFLERNSLTVSVDSYLAYLTYTDEVFYYYASRDNSFFPDDNVSEQLKLF